MFLIFLLIFLESSCRGMESDSIQEEIAQLRAQMKELTKTVENGKKREDELVKKLEGLALKEEETAKKLYGLSKQDEERTKRVDSLAAEVHEDRKAGEETALNLKLKVNGLTIKAEEIAKEVERLTIKEEETSKSVYGLTIREEEMDKKLDGLYSEVKENYKREEKMAIMLDELRTDSQETHKREEEMSKTLKGLTETVQENHKEQVETVQKLDDLTTEVRKNHTMEEEMAKQLNGLNETVQENHKEQVETANKLDDLTTEVRKSHTMEKKMSEKLNGLSTNVNEYCAMLSKGICGPCQCKDDSRLEKKYFCNCQNLPAKRDCLQHHIEGVNIDGVYRIHQNSTKVIQVYCDMTKDGGGWTVFQRRLDGSVKFYRNWDSYKRGFGDIQHEFWLGNDNLFTMSEQGLAQSGNELRIELGDWQGDKRYAKYKRFNVDNENSNYHMHVSDYSGTAGDGGNGFSFHNGRPFTTFDKNNGGYNCGQRDLGGWWYDNCAHANLNGKYADYPKWETAVPESNVIWDPFHARPYSLKFVEMKMRRKLKE